jgi:peptidoglycan/xylan/chitin deacetylase (PgdA/CDA1 family)
MSGRTVRWLLALTHRPWVPRDRARLTIVRHHRVYADHERPLYRLGVSESVLEGQLALLARHGLAPLTVAEGLARLAAEPRGRWVAMTFDDGYADNVTRALPALERHGARATFYLTAGLIERREAPWWDRLAHTLESALPVPARVAWDGAAIPLEPGDPAGRVRGLHALLPGLRVAPAEQERRLGALADTLGVMSAPPCELATWSEAARLAEAGMEIGAHTLNHPFLARLNEAEQRREIEGSRDLIAARLGVTPLGLAYPGGDHDAASIRIVTGAGFAHAVTTRPGDAAPGSPMFQLPRRGLSDGACLGPGGRFSSRLARAELDGAFDALRGTEAAA